MDVIDHGTWSMVHNLPHIFDLIIAVIVDFDDPPRYLQHQNFCITFEQEFSGFDDLMTPQGSYSVQIFVSLFRDFEQELA